MSDLLCCRLERTESYLDHLLQPALKLRAFLDDFLGFVALTFGSAGLEIRLTGAVGGNLRGGKKKGIIIIRTEESEGDQPPPGRETTGPQWRPG